MVELTDNARPSTVAHPVDNVAQRFRSNRRGYIRQHWILLILMLAAALGDMASTIYFMRIDGPEAEGHPAVRLVSMTLGPILDPIIGKLCQLAAVVIVTIHLRRCARIILITVTILYAWATWYNVWGCQLYYPRLLRILENLPF